MPVAQRELHDGASDISGTCTASRHGDEEAAYLVGCRCPAAREAHRINRGRRHLRLIRVGPAHVDSTGTRRRLQALGAAGYSVLDIAAGTGLAPSYVGQLRHRTRPIHRVTAAKVCTFYNGHADDDGPSPHARHYASRRGWLAPLWWDDDTIDDPTYRPRTFEGRCVGAGYRPKYDVDPVAVDRALRGEPSPLMRRGERLEAVRILHHRDMSCARIARHLQVSERTVERDVRDLGLGDVRRFSDNLEEAAG